jgi:hypothetical protein
MINLENVSVDYEADSGIVHLKPSEPVQVMSDEDLNALCDLVGQVMSRHCGASRCFFLVDISQLTIDPDFAHAYAEHLKGMCETYIHTDGVARYGYNITRVTARACNKSMHANDPCFFRSEADAREYLKRLREQSLPAESTV